MINKLLKKFLKQQQRRKSKGFTLLEVMISILILSAATLLTANLIPLSFSDSQSTIAASKASTLAQNYIEKVKSDFSDPVKYSELVEGVASPITITPDLTSDGEFDVKVNVSFVGPTGYEDKLTEIDLEYCKADSSSPIVSYSIIISKPDARI